MKYKTIAVFGTIIISIMLIQSVLLLTTTFQYLESVKTVSRTDQPLTSSDLGKKQQEQPQLQTLAQRTPEQQPPLAHTQRAQINRAPIATSGDKNVYVTWWSNKSGDWLQLL
jgi:hypothetical protein